MKKQILSIKSEEHNIIPNFLDFKVANSNLCSFSTYNDVKENDERRYTSNNLWLVDRKSMSLDNNVKSTINITDFLHVLNIS